jgi:hypothetical protein
VLLRGKASEVPAARTALRLGDSDPERLIVLVPVARPNVEAEFADAIRSSELTAEIERELRDGSTG